MVKIFILALLLVAAWGCCPVSKASDLPLRPEAVTASDVNLNSSTKPEAIAPAILRARRRAANQIVRYHWLDKAAWANPGIIEAITKYPEVARKLAKHPRLGDIAEANHSVCRRLTQWKSSAMALAKSSEADRVINTDPAGLYLAIEQYPGVVRCLAKNPSFAQMIIDNPELGRVISEHL